MPLAVRRAGVTGVGQKVAECSFPRDQPPATGGSQRHAVVSRADCVPSGEERRSRRRALRFRGVVGKPETLRGKRIDTTRPGPTERSTAVTTQLTEAEVVDMKKQDIGTTTHHASLRARRQHHDRSWRSRKAKQSGPADTVA